ncbi:MAG: TetR/AcrR family transcriptional regulator [Cyclobacteriaceae bacterium]|jgi:AcrR family transcriptional regulator
MEDKRSQILAAAQDIFNRLGYSKTSVDDISQAVGMKKSSLYYYFKNKEDIFMCSCKDEWEEQFKLFAEQANKQSNPADKVITYIIQSLAYYEKVVVQHKIPVKVLIETRNMYREFMDDANEGSIGFYKQCIQEGIDLGLFKPCDTRKVGESIFIIKFSIQYDSFNMFLHNYPNEKDFLNIKENIIFAIGLIIDGLKKK